MTEHAEACVTQPPHQQTQQETQQVADRAGITYIAAGDPAAAPILFLHGLGGAARSFAGQVEAFGRDHRAIAWDMPGYGGSVPLPLVGIDALALALAGFIHELGLHRPVLVGHSFGGMVAQRLLAQTPHAASALVLAQTSAAFGAKDPAWGERFIRDRLAPLDAGRSMAELAPGMVAAMVGQGADPAGLALAQDCLAHTPDSTYRDTVLALRGFDQRAALERIAIPTLVLSGSQDGNAPAAAMERMASRIPGAQYVCLDGVGHLAHLEQPARFNEALARFLGSVSPGA